MTLRIRLRPRALRACICSSKLPIHHTYASLATTSATTPAPPIEQTVRASAPIPRFPPTKPPSHRPAEVRKTQLHRQYDSLLRSSPLILLFQHNNMKADEWMGIRRELATALRKVDAERAASGHDALAHEIKIQVIQTGIFKHALRVVEFFNPEQESTEYVHHPTDPRSATSAQVPNVANKVDDPRFTHSLSRHAHEVASNRKLRHELEPLLSGPLAALSFPVVSPQHLKAVLSILQPSPAFPAPKRRTNPDYFEPAVQTGLQKLLLLGARVESKVFDLDGVRWVGGIEGGIDGLRAQLVAALQGAGVSITSALEGTSRSLYFTVESRRMDMEEQEKGDSKE